METADQLKTAREAAGSGNMLQAIELLNQCSDSAAAVDTCDDLVRDLYWKKKDIKGAIAIGRAGIDLALHEADRSTLDPAAAAALRKTARMLCYNLGSFCWTGWNEPGITLGTEEITVGRDLARQCLHLVTTYEPDPRRFARAHWLVGAHCLTARDYAAALDHFQKSETFAKEAQHDGEHLLAQGYAALTRLLQNRTPADGERLNALKIQFKSVEEGEEYVQQLEMAEAVFFKRA